MTRTSARLPTWVDDRRLSDGERATLIEWQQIGAPEGRPEDGAEVLVDNEQIVHHGFVMIDPLGTSADIADANGYYPCNGLDHALGWIASYFPGSSPTRLPEDVGALLPVGGRVVLSVHYHPTGEGASVDQSGFALRWTTEQPAFDAVITAVGNAATAAQGLHWGPADPNGIPTFLIPAGASNHTETMSAVFPDELPESELFMLTPHNTTSAPTFA